MANPDRNQSSLYSFVRCVAAALLSLAVVISLGSPAMAVSPEIRIDETETLLEDSDTSGEGYLSVEASTPIGFEGTLCVELRKKLSFQSLSIQLSPFDYYMGGQYLEPGTYTVKKVYAVNDDSAIVEADKEEVVIDTDGDTHLLLTVTTNPADEAEWLAMMETYTLPELPTDATTEATEPVVETTETTDSVKNSETSSEAPIDVVSSESSIMKNIFGLMKSLAFTALSGWIIYLIVEKIRQNSSKH